MRLIAQNQEKTELTSSNLYDSSEDINVIVALSQCCNRHNLLRVKAKISKNSWLLEYLEIGLHSIAQRPVSSYIILHWIRLLWYPKKLTSTSKMQLYALALSYFMKWWSQTWGMAQNRKLSSSSIAAMYLRHSIACASAFVIIAFRHLTAFSELSSCLKSCVIPMSLHQEAVTIGEQTSRSLFRLMDVWIT